MKKIEAQLKSAKHQARGVDNELPALIAEEKSLHEKIRKLQNQKAQHEDDFKSAQRDLERAKAKANKVDNNERQKLEMVLKRSHESLRKVTNWVQKNRSKFRKPVHGPLSSCLDCKNDAIARYVDQHCQNAVLVAFVVQTKEDSDFMYREVREKLRLPVNIEVRISASCPSLKLFLMSPPVAASGEHRPTDAEGVRGWEDAEAKGESWDHRVSRRVRRRAEGREEVPREQQQGELRKHVLKSTCFTDTFCVKSPLPTPPPIKTLSIPPHIRLASLVAAS